VPVGTLRAMPIAIDTATVAPTERFAMWHEAASRSFFPLDIRQLSDRPFAGQLVRYELVSLDAFRVTADPNLCLRTPACVEDGDPEHLQVHVLRRGRCVVSQGGRADVLTPGTMTTLDSSCSYALDARMPFELLVFAVPKALLRPYADKLSCTTATTITGAAGLGRLIVPFLDGLIRQVEDGSTVGGRAELAETLVPLLRALAVDRTGEPHRAPAPALLAKVKAYIEGHLGDQRLSPRQIAATHFISTRYLHKLFQAEGATVSASIRRARLERCRRDLADPALDRETILAIAASWGMTDAAHFSRLFRATYGCSPREFRALRN
jgi:AraC-like DNA-binding protein